MLRPALIATALAVGTIAPAEARLPFAPPPPAATAPAAIPAPNPWYAAGGEVALERWAQALDWPLRGAARVELRVTGPLPRFGVSLLVDAPALEIGGQPVGRARLRAFVPFDGDGLALRLHVDGPAGRLDLEAHLPERFSPGAGLIEAAASPWMMADPAPTEAGGDDDPDVLEALREAAADWHDAPVVRARAEAFDVERLTDLWPELALAGRVTGAASIDAAGARGAFEAVDARWRGGPLGTVRAAVELADGALHVDAEAGAEPTRAKVVVTAPVDFDPRRLDAAWRDDAPLAIALEATGITPDGLSALERFHPAADFELRLTASVTGALDDLRAVARLDGTLRDGGVSRPVWATLDATARGQTARLAVGDGPTPLVAVDLGTAADLVALRRADADPAAVPLSGAVAIGVPLTTLMPYLPAAIHDPSGAVAGALEIGGTLGRPRVDGALGIDDGALTVVAANARLFDVDLDLRFEGDGARLRTLTARTGRGRVEGRGRAGWVVTPPDHPGPLWSAWQVEADFELDLDDVPLVRPGLPAGLLDAAARLTARAEPDVAAVDITVDGTHLRLTGFRLAGARPIPRNGAVRRRSQGITREADSILSGPGALTLTLRLPDARVEGAQTTLRFGGELTLERRDTAFTVEGGILTTEGRFRLFDNPFDLTGGRFGIQGGTLDPRQAVAVAIGQAQLDEADSAPVAETLDPIIDVQATGRVVETDVRVRIVGPSRRPSLVLESDPPLPEYQILTLLITGRVDAIDDRNGEVRRQAAQLIDRFHNPSLARQLYDRLGVDKLGLKFGASVQNPILTVGKQINRRLYVETVYHHDAPPDANEKEARVEYRLSPRWTVDTVAGDAGEGSLGLFWQTTFGRPAALDAPEDGDD